MVDITNIHVVDEKLWRKSTKILVSEKQNILTSFEQFNIARCFGIACYRPTLFKISAIKNVRGNGEGPMDASKPRKLSSSKLVF